MGWKNFLKPTKWKLLIVGVVFIISIFVGFSSSNKCNGLPGCHNPIRTNKIILPLDESIIRSLFDGILSLLPTPLHVILAISGIIFITGIIYWYLISCIVAAFLKKFFTK